MILSGNDIVIISRDFARKIHDALVCNRTRADYERLAELGLLQVVEELRLAVREDSEDG